MTSIPASNFVDIIPGVLSAGGAGLQNNGLFLTKNNRMPSGSVLAFASAPNVAGYFGASSIEARLAGGGAGYGSGYFGGFNNEQAVPQSMLFANFNAAAIAAWVRGAPITYLTIPQLAALAGDLSVVMDGHAYANASVSLAGATSFSAAAALIQTALNTAPANQASFTAEIAPNATTSVTASIAGSVLTVTTVGSGTLFPGAVIAGTSITTGTEIVSQLTVNDTAPGLKGTYELSNPQATPTVVSGTVTATYGILDVSVVATGVLAVGQVINSGASAGTTITALDGGTGGTGNYIVNLTQTVAAPTAMTVGPVVDAVFVGGIAAESASFVGSISGNVLSVSSIPATPIVPGAVLAGVGVTSGTRIDSQLTGTTGGIGTYAVNATQVIPSEALTATYGLLTVGEVWSGTLSIGQQIVSGAAINTMITALGTGEGLTGTYYVDLTQAVSPSVEMTTTGPALAVTFDSIAGGFLITAGSRGAQSTAAYATGSLAPLLMLTAATGAVLSQGADPSAPGAFLTNLTNVTQNWVSYTTAFDPDGSTAGGNGQKQLFAAWANGQQDRYAYVCQDFDPSPTLSSNAATSLGQILAASNSNGTILVWSPVDMNYAAFVMGMIAAINFEATNGRITLAFKGQAGLVASVTNQSIYQNLVANGYNCYCAFATAAQQFVDFQPGAVSGAFQWADSFVNQIVLNQALQLALVELLTQVNSIPYNTAGYAMIQAAMLDPIQMALNAGIIRTGVTLSNQQISEITTQAGSQGAQVASVLQTQGYIIVIQPASPIVRQARQSPTIILWYTDGMSIQKIVVNSILVQ
jgi:hypothetical protein